MLAHATEPFGDTANRSLAGHMPIGWRMREVVILEDPRTRLRVKIEQRTGGAVLPSLVFAQDQLDSLLTGTDPAPTLMAGLAALPLHGVDGGGYVALLDLPETPDVRLHAWASHARERISICATVPRHEWDERAAEIMGVLESLQIVR